MFTKHEKHMMYKTSMYIRHNRKIAAENEHDIEKYYMTTDGSYTYKHIVNASRWLKLHVYGTCMYII